MASIPTGMPNGRPPKYKPEYCEKMLFWFAEKAEESDIKNQLDDIETELELKIAMLKYKHAIFPTLERFAFQEVQVDVTTLHAWADATKEVEGKVVLKYPEFHHTKKLCMDIRAALLQEGGLAGRYSSGFAKFAATNLLGWRDKVEDVTENGHEQWIQELMNAGGIKPDESG